MKMWNANLGRAALVNLCRVIFWSSVCGVVICVVMLALHLNDQRKACSMEGIVLPVLDDLSVSADSTTPADYRRGAWTARFAQAGPPFVHEIVVDMAKEPNTWSGALRITGELRPLVIVVESHGLRVNVSEAGEVDVTYSLSEFLEAAPQ